MSRYIIVTEKKQLVTPQEDRIIVSPSEFIREGASVKVKGHRQKPKVINLCNTFDYLNKGYYVSLLAEARGLPCAPHVSDIIALNWKKNYSFAIPELNALLKKHFQEKGCEPLTRTYTTYFGRHENQDLEPITRYLFDLFRFPVLNFEMKYGDQKSWIVTKIESGSIAAIPGERMELFQDALDKFTGSAWRSGAKSKPEKYWIAILHNPDEAMAPSDKTALNKFIKIGKQMGIWIELITKQDFASLLEYDALFIRETTAINNHTYRFAAKAEQEDIPCIDDTRSIIRCCNKVFLHELLQGHKIPVPGTLIIDRHQKLGSLDVKKFPLVLKIPDGSFSHGVHKAENMTQLLEIASKLLKKSEIILCQEFVESKFDWRIGVLGGQPLFATQYYMAKGHWQIYNHAAPKKSQKVGAHKALPLSEVPQSVIDMAVKSAKLIGNGLYGVDLKQKANGDVVVIEVNDNPNIDSGVEDVVLGDELYRKILEHLVAQIEA